MSAYNFEVLRFLRKQRGLTIEALAAKSGVSFALISKLERNIGNPGLDTLKQLGTALDISASELVAMAEVRQSEVRKSENYRSDGFDFHRVLFNNVKLICAEGKKGGRLSHPEVHEDDTEIVYVREGRIRLALPSGDRILKKGEAIQFDALFSHAYEVLENCNLVIVHTRKDKRF